MGADTLLDLRCDRGGCMWCHDEASGLVASDATLRRLMPAAVGRRRGRYSGGGLSGVDVGDRCDAVAGGAGVVRGDAVRVADSAAVPPVERVDHRTAGSDGPPVR